MRRSCGILRIRSIKQSLRSGYRRREKKVRDCRLLMAGAVVIIAVAAVHLEGNRDCFAEGVTEVSEREKSVDTQDTEAKELQENSFTGWEDIPMDRKHQILMHGLCKKYDLSYSFALMILESESAYNPTIIGDKGNSVGYFQINRINWERFADRGMNVHEPEGNIEAGVMMLSELFEKYKDPYAVIECYKCGETRGMELYNAGIYATNSFDCEALCKRSEELEKEHED